MVGCVNLHLNVRFLVALNFPNLGAAIVFLEIIHSSNELAIESKHQSMA